jgi:hypothetical protein
VTGADLLALKLGVVAAAAGGEGDYAATVKALNLVKRKRVDKALEDASQHFDAAALKEAGYSAKELKGAGYSAQELKGAGYSLKELKEAFSLTIKEVYDAKLFSDSELVQAFKGHRFVPHDPSNRVGQVVFAEGKVGTITDINWSNYCKISYSDGSKNKAMDDGDLRFANWSGNNYPVEAVYAME